jgi:hypothetical protein
VEGTSPLREAQALRKFVENEGSQLQFGIRVGEEAAFFKARGFGQISCVSSQASMEKFFTNESRKRTVSPMFNFVHATAIGHDGA